MRPLILCRLTAALPDLRSTRLLWLSGVLLLAMGTGGPPAALQAAPAPATGISPADPVPAPNQPAPALRYFADSGHILQGGFRDFWESRQGDILLGLPLTEEFAEQYTDGALETVQYFERGVLEYHPDAPAGHQITLRECGDHPARRAPIHPARPARRPGVPGDRLCRGRRVLALLARHGRRAHFGNPLSPPVIEDGRTVQYFERARFESHPEFVGRPMRWR